MTKRYKRLSFLFSLLSFLCVWGPAIYFLVEAWFTGKLQGKDAITLGSTALVAIILCLVSFIFKYHWRTPVVIILMGLYFLAENFACILLVVGICIILDELLFTPLHKKFKGLYTINREIDKRG
jgi:hypothetical protein